MRNVPDGDSSGESIDPVWNTPLALQAPRRATTACSERNIQHHTNIIIVSAIHIEINGFNEYNRILGTHNPQGERFPS